MNNVFVRDLMTSEPFAVNVEADLSRVYDTMDIKHVRHIPVVDGEGDLLGLVTHRDLVRSVLGALGELPVSNQREALRALKVAEIMQAEPETIDPGADIREAAQLMLENKFGCLPVVDNGRLIGILTEADFIKFVLTRLQTL